MAQHKPQALLVQTISSAYCHNYRPQDGKSFISFQASAQLADLGRCPLETQDIRHTYPL